MTVKDRLHQLIDELPERELASSSVAPALWEQFLSALALESERVGSERTLLAAELGLSFLRDERFARELGRALARRGLLHRDLDLRNALVHQHFRAFFRCPGFGATARTGSGPHSPGARAGRASQRIT